MTTAIKEFNETETGLAEVKARYATVPDVSTKEGYEEARIGRGVCTKIRTSLDKMRLGLNRGDQDRINLRNTEAKRITALVLEVETPIREAMKVVDDEKERIKKSAARIEAARIAQIESRVAAIQNSVNIPQTTEAIDASIEFVANVDVEDGSFMEFKDAARLTQGNTLKILEQFRTDALALEKAAEEVAEEAKRMAEERRVMAEQQAKEQQAIQEQQDALAKQQAELDAQKKVIEDEEKQRAKKEASELAEKEAAKRSAEAEAKKAEEEKIQKASRIRLAAENKEIYANDYESIIEILISLETVRDKMNNTLTSTTEATELFLEIEDAMTEIRELVEESIIFKSQNALEEK